MLGHSILLLVIASGVAANREGRQLNNMFGLLGHQECVSVEEISGVQRVGKCYNRVDCALMGGLDGGDCPQGYGEVLSQGACCVFLYPYKKSTSSDLLSYFSNEKFPSVGQGFANYEHVIEPLEGICHVRLDFLTFLISEMDGNCVHDRLQILGGKEPSGSLCGDRSGEATILEVTEGMTVTLSMVVQSPKWRWNIGITQISCDAVEKQKKEMLSGFRAVECGAKNPSESNRIGDIESLHVKGGHGIRKHNIPGLARKKARKVFKQLKKLPKLTEEERKHLKIYKPSFTRQELDFEKADFNPLGRRGLKLSWKQKGRILYGNMTDPNEYPWQVSMWIDRSHFCGGTLISEDWIVTAAHCVDLQYRRHFKRITVSLGDHNVDVYDEARNTFRKLKRIVRSPQYDNNFINGDLALLQLEDPVEFTSKIHPACLPTDIEEDFGYAKALITGWGYTEKTKILKPRPLTSSDLMEAEVYILPQDLCHKYSPFPITDRMVCTFKGPLGVETTCQGDSGGPLVVNMADNKFVLVGAVSFGVSTCEGPYPSMFARITTHMDFIMAAMVPAPMEYMMDYQTPPDPKLWQQNSTALFNIFPIIGND